MKPERWQQIDSLLDAVLEREPAGRAAFLDEACGGDAELREEIESLLAAHGEAKEVIEAPALDVAARLLAEDKAVPERDMGRLAVGESIGRYEIRGLLGKGGMGEVYLARDSALQRPVALKLLPIGIGDEQDRLRRFEQEARAVSALNHPNILTVHEVGQTGSVHFIATEFIDGVTLRQRISDGRMAIVEMLDITIQAASALAAAHRAGIVHRDIKPENIMVRPDGYVKVLDFGIAKFTARVQQAPVELEAATKQLFKTQTGMVIGTANYMSPEQARGFAVDARTDIWSLGCVLYEMCTARAAFDGATQGDVLVSILDKEPLPLTDEAKRLPVELERIVTKALRKDREERYQNIEEMARDLKNLKGRLEFEAELERSIPPGKPDVPTRLAAPVELETITRLSPAVRAPTRAPDSAETTTPVVSNDKRLSSDKKRLLIFASVVALLLLATVIIAVSVRQPTVAPSPVASAPIASSPVATSLERVLNYSITVQKYRDGAPYQKPFDLSGEINFEKDYRVRLNIRSSQRGYLYILNERPGASGEAPTFNVLFPSPTANGDASLVASDQRIQIPERSWFQFDAEEGTELIWLVWAADKQPVLEAVKRFANPTDRGLIGDSDDARAVREFLKAHSAFALSVERNDDRKETSVSVADDILAHAIKLEHH